MTREMGAAQSLEEFLEAARCEPGEGPFRIKGSGYNLHQRWVEESLPGGMEAQMRRLGPLADHPFFSEIFLASGMYDVFPLVALGYVCAELRDEPLTTFVEMRARYQAEKDLQLFRKWMVKLAGPATLAKRFPSILASYFDFGEASSDVGVDAVSGRMNGAPQILAPWLIATCRGFTDHALMVNGAKDVVIETHIEPRPRRTNGFALCDLCFEFRWS
jgi:hypothetical protein